ncbi:Crp/Fnr family transcriptional regulator [Paenibacillus crassostreae]|uniref:Crp/Fnr family transcriptional regulator n=1 Tax=Paenibacillus crassostreae TaxID=1763538 RepID=A0A167FEE9_9BACL|nr:Crp/Fnr family transcriptional regulator [Paenibacillus crassostreae]AOZ90769.1 hypothetical protein LPB68_00150 [Paenibacillus crassostreae]AOZ94493.1 hypothetical protein LPB68_21355 [Paenibacillus crassostreae]OAB76466.1 hypothetical protein PNBC_03385 [Paenibacillus crassostreae]
MLKDLNVLQKTTIFKGLSSDEIQIALSCLDVQYKVMKKMSMNEEHFGEFIGTLYLNKDDYNGDRQILTILKPGNMFGEQSLHTSRAGDAYNYNIYAAEDSEVLFLYTKCIMSNDQPIFALRGKMIENLFTLMINNKHNLHHKLNIVSHRTLRQRVLHYLEMQSGMTGTDSFFIPFSRTELVDYLNVDRSALSRELATMKKNGLIEFTRNHFTLLK